MNGLLWTLSLAGWGLAAALATLLSLSMFLGASPRRDQTKKKTDR